jgi:hypothetical protein
MPGRGGAAVAAADELGATDPVATAGRESSVNISVRDRLG